nr:NADH dehydrogenase subunit 4 [Aspiculuris sp. PC-2022]
MVFFLLLGFCFLVFGLLFCYFLLFFLFFCLNSVCWGGYFFFFDSYVFLVVVFMSFFILGLVLMSELSGVMVFLCEVLVLVCLFFFLSVNMFMVYVFFELSVFPILVMILGYGSQVEKVGASYYLVFYALFCSAPFLYVYFCSSFLLFFAYYDLVVTWELGFCLVVCFLVKFPVYFLHLWLPKAHVEAPTSASMMLAGLLLKLGTLGLYRLLLVFSYVFVYFWVLWGVFGMVVCCYLCLLQSDVKSLVAYSSIVHMSFVLMVLVVFCGACKLGGVLMMISHGYVSSLMFYLVGEFYHVSGTRVMGFLGGFLLVGFFLVYMVVLVFLCNAGLPPSLSFFSEILGLLGVYVLFKGLLVFLFFYFFVGFYFSLYFLLICMGGGSYVNFGFFNVFYVVVGIVFVFNFFWVGLLF